MKKINLLAGIFFLFFTLIASGQCDYRLNEKTLEATDTNTTFVRDFRVNLKAGTPKKPTPLTKYALYLEKGNVYYINYKNDSLLPGKAIIHLYKKNTLLESNYHVATNQTKELLSYYCQSTGNYRLYISFKEAQKGCVAVVLSKKRLDSPDEDTLSEKPEVLYIGIENVLEIKKLDETVDSIQYNISKGELIQKNGELIARVYSPGKVYIEMTVRDSLGQIKHNIQTPFMAEPVPQPRITLNGKSNGFMNKNALLMNNQLQMHFLSSVEADNFEITGFMVSTERDGMEGIRAWGDRLSPSQQQFIENLQPGERFFIKNIYVQGPNNVTLNTGSLQFIIQ